VLALIAGRGDLPDRIAAEAGPVLVCALADSPPDTLRADLIFRLERLGEFLRDLKSRGVTRICMAGGVDRPQISLSRLSFSTLRLLPTMRRALRMGDDNALRAVIAVFEQAGFTVVAAHDLLPDLVMSPGCATRAQPSADARQDAQRAADILAAMDRADIGQACVVQGGQALAIEGVFGTDWMLASLTRRPAARGTGGILYKTPKPGQDRRADLPTIGPETVAGAVAAGLDGIVIEAGGVIVLNAAQVIADCDAAGLFLWIRESA